MMRANDRRSGREGSDNSCLGQVDDESRLAKKWVEVTHGTRPLDHLARSCAKSLTTRATAKCGDIASMWPMKPWNFHHGVLLIYRVHVASALNLS